MDWFLYGRDLRHERVYISVYIKNLHISIRCVFRTLSNIYDEAFAKKVKAKRLLGNYKQLKKALLIKGKDIITLSRGVFRTLLNVYDGAFFENR